jgi:hypothetical protein
MLALIRQPISFPTTLDVFDFCSDDLKATMKISRDRNAEKILNEFKDVRAASALGAADARPGTNVGFGNAEAEAC